MWSKLYCGKTSNLSFEKDRLDLGHCMKSEKQTTDFKFVLHLFRMWP